MTDETKTEEIPGPLGLVRGALMRAMPNPSEERRYLLGIIDAARLELDELEERLRLDRQAELMEW